METVAVIMPALNEEGNIARAIGAVLDALDSLDIPGELIVVNDASTDKTRQIVEEKIRSDSRIRIINNAKSENIGGAFWRGVDASTCDFTVLVPGDGETIPVEILRYYSLMSSVDIVVPFVCNRSVRSFCRNFISIVYRLIIDATFLINLNYTNGTVLYRTSILKQLPYRCKNFFYQTDILVRLLSSGYLFAEVPYRLTVRVGGTSKALTLKSFVRVAKAYADLVRDIYFSSKCRVGILSGTSTYNRLVLESQPNPKNERSS